MGGKTDSQGGRGPPGSPSGQARIGGAQAQRPSTLGAWASHPQAPAPVAIAGRASIQPWGPGPWPGLIDLLAHIHPTAGPGEVGTLDPDSTEASLHWPEMRHRPPGGQHPGIGAVPVLAQETASQIWEALGLGSGEALVSTDAL